MCIWEEPNILVYFSHSLHNLAAFPYKTLISAVPNHHTLALLTVLM